MADPIDFETPFSPGWWMQTLSRKLEQRNAGFAWTPTALSRPVDARPGLTLLRRWYRGDPPLPVAAKGWQEAFREYLRLSRMNYAQLVIEPTRHRMKPAGWRTAVAGDDAGDAEALRIARANDLDVVFSDVAKDMLSLADAYMIVGEPQKSLGGIPLITGESPLNTITAEDGATRVTRSALKLAVDEWTGDQLAFVYMPGEVFVARQGSSSTPASSGAGWHWDEDLSGPLPDGLGDVVPVVRFSNLDGVGDYEPHLDVLARINDGILNRVVIGKLQAFRQRAVQLESDKDEQGQPVDLEGLFEADPGAMWVVGTGDKFWESSPVDLTPLRMAIKDDVESLAAATSTPLHLINPDAAAGSAAGANLLRESHIFKVEDRRARAAGSLARVMGLAFRIMGQSERADVTQIETLWYPAERYSLAEMGSATAQAAASLPWQEIMTRIWQYRPDEIARLTSERAADLMYAAVNAPTVIAGGTSGGGTAAQGSTTGAGVDAPAQAEALKAALLGGGVDTGSTTSGG